MIRSTTIGVVNDPRYIGVPDLLTGRVTEQRAGTRETVLLTIVQECSGMDEANAIANAVRKRGTMAPPAEHGTPEQPATAVPTRELLEVR